MVECGRNGVYNIAILVELTSIFLTFKFVHKVYRALCSPMHGCCYEKCKRWAEDAAIKADYNFERKTGFEDYKLIKPGIKEERTFKNSNSKSLNTREYESYFDLDENNDEGSRFEW